MSESDYSVKMGQQTCDGDGPQNIAWCGKDFCPGHLLDGPGGLKHFATPTTSDLAAYTARVQAARERADARRREREINADMADFGPRLFGDAPSVLMPEEMARQLGYKVISKTARHFLDCLSDTPLTASFLAAQTWQPRTSTRRRLAELEAAGLARRVAGGWVRV